MYIMGGGGDLVCEPYFIKHVFVVDICNKFASLSNYTVTVKDKTFKHFVAPRLFLFHCSYREKDAC